MALVWRLLDARLVTRGRRLLAAHLVLGLLRGLLMLRVGLVVQDLDALDLLGDLDLLAVHAKELLAHRPSGIDLELLGEVADLDFVREHDLALISLHLSKRDLYLAVDLVVNKTLLLRLIILDRIWLKETKQIAQVSGEFRLDHQHYLTDNLIPKVA